MTLHYQTVSEPLLKILRDLMQAEAFNRFTLVGGTALSLQRGHRRSIDIDLFTDMPYGEMPLQQMREYLEQHYPVHDGTEWMNESALGYSVRLGDGQTPPIKVDFFYTDPFIFPIIQTDGIRLADQREIGAMKMLAIVSPVKRQKDFWDIAELMNDYPLHKLVDYGLKRNEYSLSREDIVESLLHAGEVNEAPEGIINLRPTAFWELMVLDIEAAAQEL